MIAKLTEGLRIQPVISEIAILKTYSLTKKNFQDFDTFMYLMDELKHCHPKYMKAVLAKDWFVFGGLRSDGRDIRQAFYGFARGYYPTDYPAGSFGYVIEMNNIEPFPPTKDNIAFGRKMVDTAMHLFSRCDSADDAVSLAVSMGNGETRWKERP